MWDNLRSKMWDTTNYAPKSEAFSLSRVVQFRQDVVSVLGLLVVIASYVLVCYLAVFDNRIKENIALLCVLYACDLLYLVDIIYRISLYKKGKAKLYRKLKIYKTVTFITDFVSLVPIEVSVWVYRYNKKNVDEEEPIRVYRIYLLVFCLLRLNRLLRIYRVGAYFTGKAKELRLNVYRREIFASFICFLCSLIILFHGFASVWYLLNCEPIWQNKAPNCYGITPTQKNREGFKNRTIYWDHPYYSHVNRTIADPFGWYVGSLHWTMMSLRNSGNRYTTPENPIDMVISSLIMLFGFLMCTVVTFFLIYILSELDLRRSIFFHEAYAVKSFVKHFDMLKSVATFSDSCFNFMWNRQRGYSDDAKNGMSMKDLLPKTVQTEIGMCVIQMMLETSELLRCLPVEALKSISLEAILKHCFANEFLIRPNTMVHSAFYIVSGNVEVLSDSVGVSPIVLLTKGTLIAERELFFPSYRKHGVKTRTPCDILVLNSETVTRLLTVYPKARAKIHSILKERAVWIKARKHQLQLHLEKDQASQKNVQDKSDEKTLSKHSSSVKLKREGTMAEPVESVDDNLETQRGSVFRATGRRATGTQFMSVLAWLSFLRDRRRFKKHRTTIQNDNIYEYLQYKWRNVASVQMYKILPLEDKPNYIFRSPFRCIISKDSTVYHFWEIFIMIYVIIVCFLYPFELAFNQRKYYWYMNLLTGLLYGLDLVLRLFVFHDAEEMNPLVSVGSHVLHEIRVPSIAVDVIPCLPFYFLSFMITGLSDREHSYLWVHTNIKFFRVVMMFKKFENDVRVKIFTVRFFKNSIYISLYILWIACIFFMLGCPNYPRCDDNELETWVPFSVQNTTHSQAAYQFLPGNDSVFALSLYWAICTTYGIGFNDIALQTRGETVTHSLGLLLGFCLLSHFYADLSSTLSGALENAIHHQDNVVWLTRYLDDALIDLRLIDRVVHYLNVQWQVLRGISSEAQRSQGFLTISHSMYMELVVDYVADFLYRTSLLKHLDTDTMRKFCLAAKLAVVPPNEVIICSGDFIRRMYVIRRGYVQAYLGDSNITVGLLEPGSSFGELNMFFGTPSHVTLKSITYLEVIILDNASFDRILPSAIVFAEAIDDLRNDAEARMNFQHKFMLAKGRQARRRSRHSQPMSTNKNTYVYKKTIKNARGKVVNLRHMSNNPYDSEFNKLKKCRFLRFFFMPLTFLPNGPFIRCWEFFRICSIMLTAILVPLIEAFPNMKNDVEYYVFILDAISLIDNYIRLHTAYRDPSTNNLITHPLLTAKNYLRSACLIDVMGSLPVYVLINLCLRGSRYESKVWAYLLKLNRLILLYRVYGYHKFKSIKGLKGKNTWKSIKLLSLLAFQAHLIACILALATCPATQKNSNPSPRCIHNSWIMQSKSPKSLVQNKPWDDVDIYIISFYTISTTSMGCGFGDFHPYNQDERILVSIFFFCYIFLRAYVLASIVGSKCHMDHKLLGFQKQMNYLVRFLARERLENRLNSRIISYYEYQWRRTQGIEPQKLFANLFPSLRKEVAMDVFEDVMRQLPELKRVPPSFLRAICVYLTPIYFLRHDIIVQKDDVCDYIYFISRGRVLQWREEGEFYLEVGDYIGVMDVTIIRPIYVYTAAAVTNVDIFGIRRKDFSRIVNYYPHIAKRFSAQRNRSTGFVEEKGKELPKDQMKDLPPTPTANEDRGDDAFKEIHESADNARQSLSEIVALVIEQDQKQDKADGDRVYSSSVLLDSRSYRYLEIVTFFAALISTSLATYQWSFQEFGYAIFSIGYLMDVVYIVRMGLSFRISFFDSSGDFVSDLSEIKNKYLSDPRGFALDFISTFPFEIFVGSMLLGEQPKSLVLKKWWTNLRINRVLRLVQIWYFFDKKTNTLTGNLVRTKLERLACFSLLYFHFLACILHGFSHMGEYGSNCTRTVDVTQKWACDEPKRWFQTKFSTNYYYRNETYGPYIWSMYFVLGTFTTTAYGDLLPVSYFEMLLISLIAFSSMIWFALTLSDILSGQQATLDASYHLAADVVLKLYQDYGVSHATIQKTIRYFTFAWARNKGVIVPEFLVKAPACLKMDICTATYGAHFRTGYLFQNLPEDFVRQASIRLRHFWVLAGDYVIRQNEIDSNLYFIHRGYVEYNKESTDEDERAVVDLGYLGKSSSFGECLIGPEPHAYSYKAQVNVDMVSLSPSDFQELFELFPQHKSTLVRRVMAQRKAAALSANLNRTRSHPATTNNEEDASRLISQWNLKRMMMTREVEVGTYEEG